MSWALQWVSNSAITVSQWAFWCRSLSWAARSGKFFLQGFLHAQARDAGFLLEPNILHIDTCLGFIVHATLECHTHVRSSECVKPRQGHAIFLPAGVVICRMTVANSCRTTVLVLGTYSLSPRGLMSCGKSIFHWIAESASRAMLSDVFHSPAPFTTPCLSQSMLVNKILLPVKLRVTA